MKSLLSIPAGFISGAAAGIIFMVITKSLCEAIVVGIGFAILVVGCLAWKMKGA